MKRKSLENHHSCTSLQHLESSPHISSPLAVARTNDGALVPGEAGPGVGLMDPATVLNSNPCFQAPILMPFLGPLVDATWSLSPNGLNKTTDGTPLTILSRFYP